MKFRLLVGNHFEAGRTYNFQKDPIVESSRDLVEIFGSAKFKKLEEVTSTPPVITSAKQLDTMAQEDLDEDTDVEDTDVEDTEDLDEDDDTDDDEEEIDPQFLTTLHKGGGRYVVIDARTDEPIHEGTMTKKEAIKLANGE